MSLFEIIAILLTLSALFAYVNARFIGMPTTIGVMAIALGLSLVLVVLQESGMNQLSGWADRLIGSVDFDRTLLHGMLGFLLFAGALHVDLDVLADQKWAIGLLATVGVLTSTVVVGTGLWLLAGWIDISLPFIYCLLFGAIISPTDPIAVLAILKTVGAPAPLYTKIAGESLFNDGIAFTLFLVISGIALGQQEATVSSIGLLFVEEAVGGVVLGLVAGGAAYLLLRGIDSYQVEVLITLALVTGAYALAMRLHMSGPLTVVVAGLLIGNQGRRFAMSRETVEYLDTFWELVDEVLNAVLFLLIGLEMLVISFSLGILTAGLFAIPLVLAARLVAVGLPLTVLGLVRESTPSAVRALIWGGLRGGISVAMALSLADVPERDLLVGMTYVVVVFSILVQGLTVRRVIMAG
jgi:CPA1 family monovalent cation:H+ antiporter